MCNYLTPTLFLHQLCHSNVSIEFLLSAAVGHVRCVEMIVLSMNCDMFIDFWVSCSSEVAPTTFNF